jgi:ABC-type molybdate transport system substrate-binding protein
LHDPIVYPAAVVVRRDGGTSPGAKRFLEYLKSEAAQAILRKHGFAPTTQPAASEAPATRPSAP